MKRARISITGIVKTVSSILYGEELKTTVSAPLALPAAKKQKSTPKKKNTNSGKKGQGKKKSNQKKQGKKNNKKNNTPKQKDKIMDPVLLEINEYKEMIAKAEDDIKKAKSFEQQLMNTINKKQRAIVHEECENYFGISSPGKIISRELRNLNQLKRDLEKCERRFRENERLKSMTVKNVIIDGSNMCYNNNNQFIGLCAVKKAIDELQKKYRVAVVFDHSIHRKLNMNEKSIRKELGGKAEMLVAPSRHTADEIIMELADNDTSYIISNDRFGEYRNCYPVKNHHIIQHRVSLQKVLIPDLHIAVSYGAA